MIAINTPNKRLLFVIAHKPIVDRVKTPKISKFQSVKVFPVSIFVFRRKKRLNFFHQGFKGEFFVEGFHLKTIGLAGRRQRPKFIFSFFLKLTSKAYWVFVNFLSGSIGHFVLRPIDRTYDSPTALLVWQFLCGRLLCVVVSLHWSKYLKCACNILTVISSNDLIFLFIKFKPWLPRLCNLMKKK